MQVSVLSLMPDGKRRDSVLDLPITPGTGISTEDLVLAILRGSLKHKGKKPDKEIEKQTLLAFKDGLFLLFHNQQKVLPDSELHIMQENDTVACIQLTFLTHGYSIANWL